jgi:hypothetical protein
LAVRPGITPGDASGPSINGKAARLDDPDGNTQALLSSVPYSENIFYRKLGSP